MTSPCNLSLDEVTQRDWSSGLVPRAGPMIDMKHFEEQVGGTCPKNSNWSKFVGLVTGTTKLVPATRF